MKAKVDFVRVLEENRNLVWPVIEEKLKLLSDFPDYCRVDKKYQDLIDFQRKIIADYPERKGKYLRQTLKMLTAKAMGCQQKTGLITAAAMQMSEDWILNHDDIEDNSPYRRGKPALHQIYGVELALNAGDALHILMWRVLWDNFKLLGTNKSLMIGEEFFQMLNRTVFGQGIELKWAADKEIKLNDEDHFLVLESKTGYYTIAGPMRLGAIVAGANAKQLNLIYRFGVILGRSFQIVDDLLDLTSDFAGQKKTRGGDILENKKTLMVIHLLKSAKPGDREKIKNIFFKSRGEKTAGEVAWVIEMMKKYGSLNYGQKLAKKFADQAKKMFKTDLKFLKRQPYRNQIEAGIDFVVNRKS